MSATTEPRRDAADHPDADGVDGRTSPASPTGWRRWGPPLLFCLAAAALLFTRLGEPSRIIFDETYYVNDALAFLETGGVEDSFAVHPPVGKWLIATSIRLFGDEPFGWRAAGAAAGVAMVLLTWLTSMRLFRRTWQAAVACSLLVLDGLFIVQSRTSMLDIFLALFVLGGAWALVRDVEDLDRSTGTAAELVARSLRWRWLAGLSFGLAIATKWSGLLAIGGSLVLLVAFELFARRRVHGTMRRRLGRLAWVVVGPLLLVPVATYLVSYVPWLVAYEHTTEGQDDCREATEAGDPCTYPIGARLRGLAREHVDIARFHRDLESTHSYRAEPWTWPVMGRPIAYYYESCPLEAALDDDADCEVPPGTAAEVLALGNPALWWGFAALLPVLTAAMGRRHSPTWILAGFYGSLFVPWLLVARPAFFFYMAPAVPFMAMGAAAAVGHVAARPRDGLPWLAGGGIGTLAAVVMRVLGATAVPTAIAFATGWVLAPLAVAWGTQRRREAAGRGQEAQEQTPRVRIDALEQVRPVARWWQASVLDPEHGRVVAFGVAGLLVGTALVLFAWFFPIWLGIPMDADALRARWWFESWI